MPARWAGAGWPLHWLRAWEVRVGPWDLELAALHQKMPSSSDPAGSQDHAFWRVHAQLSTGMCAPPPPPARAPGRQRGGHRGQGRGRHRAGECKRVQQAGKMS